MSVTSLRRHGATALLVLLGLLVSRAPAQTLYGMDGPGALVWEFTSASGAPCGQPVPVVFPCPYAGTPCPAISPPPGPVPAPPFPDGAMCVDSLADTFFLTDGLLIEEYAAGGPCGGFPCMPLNVFLTPPLAAGIKGMALDELGTTFGLGAREMWLTDGLSIVCIAPSAVGSCAAPVVLFGPCPIPTPGVAQGLTWDPVTLSLWACDSLGMVTNIAVPGCAAVITFPMPGICIPIAAPLFGISYDLATPDVLTGAPGALYVTDGFSIERVDVLGVPAPPTFYAPAACTPTPMPLNGLASSLQAIGFGAPRVAATLTSFGQSSSPGPTFGIEISGSPPDPAYLFLNFNVPGPGFFCPPLPGVGTLFWVDPGGAILIPLGVLPPACVPIPIAIPPAFPAGLRGFMQVVYKPGGLPSTDATNGLAFSFGPP